MKCTGIIPIVITDGSSEGFKQINAWIDHHFDVLSSYVGFDVSFVFKVILTLSFVYCVYRCFRYMIDL